MNKYAEMLGIEEMLNKYPNQLSGGQQQRVAIARALVSENNIILADEPTGALDEKNRDELMDIFDRINGMGRTILVVTHDINVANRSKRLIEIKNGMIVKC